MNDIFSPLKKKNITANVEGKKIKYTPSVRWVSLIQSQLKNSSHISTFYIDSNICGFLLLRGDKKNL